jgi:hypothetical protein
MGSGNAKPLGIGDQDTKDPFSIQHLNERVYQIGFYAATCFSKNGTTPCHPFALVIREEVALLSLLTDLVLGNIVQTLHRYHSS